MKHSWLHFLAYGLLFSVLIFGGEVFAQFQDATANDSMSTETAVEESSNNDEASSDAIEEETSKSEETSDNEETSDSKETTEKEAVEEKNTSDLHIVVQQARENGLPIENARVMVTHESGKEYSFQTNVEGEVIFSDLPYGKIDIDVTSSGRKSAAKKLVLDDSQETLTISLLPRTNAE